MSRLVLIAALAAGVLTSAANSVRAADYVTIRKAVEVEFAEWTADRSVRYPSFQGVRQDKSAKGGEAREKRMKPNQKAQICLVKRSDRWERQKVYQPWLYTSV